MDAPLPIEDRLALYTDTACRDTGQYFCNFRPFAMPRLGNRVSMLSCGRDAMAAIHAAMMGATSFIWIADWQMAFDVELARTDQDKTQRASRLHHVIETLISRKPVQVRILLYRSILDTKPGTFDGMVARKLNALNRPGYPGSVQVLLQGATSDQRDAFDYSHHQKFVVVDGRVGFLGGIDLAYGRWETPEFDVVVDPDRFLINDMYSPGQTKLRPASATEKALIQKFDLADPYFGHLIDEGCQPRMPWQDVHVKIEGPSVVDIHRNFARRWNALVGQFAGAPAPSTLHRIDRGWLQRVGAWSLLSDAQQPKPGGAQVQVVRSVSSHHLALEGREPEDLQLYPDPNERNAWLQGLKAWGGQHQANILTAMVNCIRSADNYIYIESQFFISGFGIRGSVDSHVVGNEDNGIQNGIAVELAARIGQHIIAGTPFHVYLVIPVHPEGPLSDGSVWQQHWLALSTLKHGSDSLVNRIRRALVAKGRDPEEWTAYLTVLNMRNYGATVMYARDPNTFDEDFDCEIGRFVVTEQIYIHSKLMIVDDAVAIVGSANTNDRSLTGNGDTEIAAIIVDTEGVELRDLGSPNFKVQTRKFARELRQMLWKKHFGFLIDGRNGYFRSTDRAARHKSGVNALAAYPPRDRTTDGALEAKALCEWTDILERPCDPEVVAAIQRVARNNASAYQAVFAHVPTDSTATFAEVDDQYCLPYPCRFDAIATPYVPGQAAERARTAGLRLSDRDLANADEAQRRTWDDAVRDAGRDVHFAGVVPPALRPSFMTTHLLAQQRSALRDPHFYRRQLVYAEGAVHDVDQAIKFLKDNVVGFLVQAPLDWGVHQRIKGDPTKFSTIDIADNRTGERNKPEASA